MINVSSLGKPQASLALLSLVRHFNLVRSDSASSFSLISLNKLACSTRGKNLIQVTLQKGGVPAAPSGTATLLRLHPPHPPHLRRLPPLGWAGDFGCRRLGWCDGRCVQGPGTHSPRHADPRLLATPSSCGRVAAHNLN